MPALLDRVLPVHAVVPVEVYLPGCPPPAARIRAPLEQVLAGATPRLEGRFISFVPADDADRALAVLRRHRCCADARCIGRVSAHATAAVILKSSVGASRIVDMLSREQLPRIC